MQWNSYYQKWLMTCLVDPTGQVVVRMSGSLTGPWSAPQVIVDSSQYPELYAPYITPLWDNGPDIYFNMSVYDHYQVYLMHTSLTPAIRNRRTQDRRVTIDRSVWHQLPDHLPLRARRGLDSGTLIDAFSVSHDGGLFSTCMLTG